MATAYLNIGSNTGDRRSNIGRAVALIEEQLGISVRLSDEFVSAPWGFESPNTFINVGVAFATTLAPLTLHRQLQSIQKQIDPSPHRAPDGTYIDRAIDIDLIAIDDIVMATDELTLPHPRMHLRDFVITPMRELAPGWTHPLLGALWGPPVSK